MSITTMVGCNISLIDKTHRQYVIDLLEDEYALKQCDNENIFIVYKIVNNGDVTDIDLKELQNLEDEIRTHLRGVDCEVKTSLYNMF